MFYRMRKVGIRGFYDSSWEVRNVVHLNDFFDLLIVMSLFFEKSGTCMAQYARLENLALVGN